MCAGYAGPSAGKGADMFPAMLDHIIRTAYPRIWEAHRGADLPAGLADSKFNMCVLTTELLL